jgi:hypothetical protein
MKTIIKISILGFFLFLTSCATIFTGTTQRVSIDSNPQGANIIIDGQKKGKTPSIVKIDREFEAFLDGGKEIQLEINGYKKDGYTLDAELNPVSIINLFNVLCWGIDVATGAITRYDNHSNFEMIPLQENISIPNKKDSGDKYEKLTKLKKLLDEEIITKEEYDKEKAKILAE